MEKELNRVGPDPQENLSEDEKTSAPDDEEKDQVQQEHLFHDFVENTTLHGIKYVTNPVHSKPRRLVWTVLFVGMVCLVTTAIVSHVGEYLKYSTITVISFDTPKDTEFPKVTICNCNAVTKSSLDRTGIKSAELFGSMSGTGGLRTRTGRQSEGSNETDITGSEETDIMGVDVNLLGRDVAHNIDTMLLNCQWGGEQECSPVNFTQVWTDVGVCYELNGKDAAGGGVGLKSTVTGVDGGLWLQLNVEKSEYTEDNDFGSCFKVAIQPREHTSLIRNVAMAAAPGDHTIIGLKKHWSMSLPGPYDTNCSEERLQYFQQYNYSTSACKMEFLTNASMAKCGCIAPYMPASSGFPYCNLQRLQCVTDYVATSSQCDCNTPCYEEVYSSQVSYARASGNAMSNEMRRAFNWSKEEEKENVVEISIYFEDFREEWVNQKPAMGVFSLMSSVGGELGLLLGGSVITIFEFIDFFVSKQALRCQWMKRKLRDIVKKKQPPIDE